MSAQWLQNIVKVAEYTWICKGFFKKYFHQSSIFSHKIEWNFLQPYFSVHDSTNNKTLVTAIITFWLQGKGGYFKSSNGAIVGKIPVQHYGLCYVGCYRVLACFLTASWNNCGRSSWIWSWAFVCCIHSALLLSSSKPLEAVDILESWILHGGGWSRSTNWN